MGMTYSLSFMRGRSAFIFYAADILKKKNSSTKIIHVY